MVFCVLYAYCQSYSDLRGYSNEGGVRVIGWYSVLCTRTVRVTLTYADTLTRGGEGGRVVIHVLYAYCQSYSDLRGYSDKGGAVRVLSELHLLTRIL